MKQNIFLYEYLKIILHLYQLKNSINILLALLGMNRENLMENLKNVLEK